MVQRVLIDACVLFPSLVRSIVTEVAAQGIFAPLWSGRIFDEWRLAVARKHGLVAEQEVVAAQTLLNQQFSAACVPPETALEQQITLPDPADAHVLAAAITGQADVLMTFNLRDFPQRTASVHGIQIVHPDGFLWGLLGEHEGEVSGAVLTALETAGVESDRHRAVLKRAKLPRFAKALEGL